MLNAERLTQNACALIFGLHYYSSLPESAACANYSLQTRYYTLTFYTLNAIPFRTALSLCAKMQPRGEVRFL